MSETERIREAARALHRQRPHEENTHYSNMRSAAPITPADLAERYRELANRARLDLRRRISGIGELFGEDVSAPLVGAAEELVEAWAACVDEHERYQRDLFGRIGKLSRELEDAYGTTADVLAVLELALDDFKTRTARTPVARRTTPPWVSQARNLDVVPPF